MMDPVHVLEFEWYFSDSDAEKQAIIEADISSNSFGVFPLIACVVFAGSQQAGASHKYILIVVY